MNKLSLLKFLLVTIIIIIIVSSSSSSFINANTDAKDQFKIIGSLASFDDPQFNGGAGPGSSIHNTTHVFFGLWATSGAGTHCRIVEMATNTVVGSFVISGRFSLYSLVANEERTEGFFTFENGQIEKVSLTHPDDMSARSSSTIPGSLGCRISVGFGNFIYTAAYNGVGLYRTQMNPHQYDQAISLPEMSATQSVAMGEGATMYILSYNPCVIASVELNDDASRIPGTLRGGTSSSNINAQVTGCAGVFYSQQEDTVYVGGVDPTTSLPAVARYDVRSNKVTGVLKHNSYKFNLFYLDTRGYIYVRCTSSAGNYLYLVRIDTPGSPAGKFGIYPEFSLDTATKISFPNDNNQISAIVFPGYQSAAGYFPGSMSNSQEVVFIPVSNSGGTKTSGCFKVLLPYTPPQIAYPPGTSVNMSILGSTDYNYPGSNPQLFKGFDNNTHYFFPFTELSTAPSYVAIAPFDADPDSLAAPLSPIIYVRIDGVTLCYGSATDSTKRFAFLTFASPSSFLDKYDMRDMNTRIHRKSITQTGIRTMVVVDDAWLYVYFATNPTYVKVYSTSGQLEEDTSKAVTLDINNGNGLVQVNDYMFLGEYQNNPRIQKIYIGDPASGPQPDRTNLGQLTSSSGNVLMSLADKNGVHIYITLAGHNAVFRMNIFTMKTEGVIDFTSDAPGAQGVYSCINMRDESILCGMYQGSSNRLFRVGSSENAQHNFTIIDSIPMPIGKSGVMGFVGPTMDTPLSDPRSYVGFALVGNPGYSWVKLQFPVSIPQDDMSYRAESSLLLSSKEANHGDVVNVIHNETHFFWILYKPYITCYTGITQISYNSFVYLFTWSKRDSDNEYGNMYACTDPTNPQLGFFSFQGSDAENGLVVKMNLRTMEKLGRYQNQDGTRVAMGIACDGQYVYWLLVGSFQPSFKRLNQSTMRESLAPRGNYPLLMARTNEIILHSYGGSDFVFFININNPVMVSKMNRGTLTQNASSLDATSAVGHFFGGWVIDHTVPSDDLANQRMYIATRGENYNQEPSVIWKFRLHPFQKINGITVGDNDARIKGIWSLTLDAQGRSLYAGTGTQPTSYVVRLFTDSHPGKVFSVDDSVSPFEMPLELGNVINVGIVRNTTSRFYSGRSEEPYAFFATRGMLEDGMMKIRLPKAAPPPPPPPTTSTTQTSTATEEATKSSTTSPATTTLSSAQPTNESSDPSSSSGAPTTTANSTSDPVSSSTPTTQPGNASSSPTSSSSTFVPSSSSSSTTSTITTASTTSTPPPRTQTHEATPSREHTESDTIIPIDPIAKLAASVLPEASKAVLVSVSAAGASTYAKITRNVLAAGDSARCAGAQGAENEAEAEEIRRKRYDIYKQVYLQNYTRFLVAKATSNDSSLTWNATMTPFDEFEKSPGDDEKEPYLEPLGIDSNPLGLEIGFDDFKTYRGAIVGNFLIFLMFALIALLIAVIRNRCKGGGETFRDSLAKTHFYSSVSLPVCVLFPATIYAIGQMLMVPQATEAGSDKAMIGFGFVYAFIMPLAIYGYICRILKQTKAKSLKVTEPTLDLNKMNCFDIFIYYFYWLMEPLKEWKINLSKAEQEAYREEQEREKGKKKDSKNKNRDLEEERKRREEEEKPPKRTMDEDEEKRFIAGWKFLFETWGIWYFPVFDLSTTFVLSIVGGVGASCATRDCCTATSAASLAFASIHLVLQLWYRPHLPRFDSFFVPLMMLLTVGLSGIGVVANMSSNPDGMLSYADGSTIFVFAASWVGATMGFIANFFIPFLQSVARNLCKKKSKDDEDDDEKKKNRNNEDYLEDEDDDEDGQLERNLLGMNHSQDDEQELLPINKSSNRSLRPSSLDPYNEHDVSLLHQISPRARRAKYDDVHPAYARKERPFIVDMNASPAQNKVLERKHKFQEQIRLKKMLEAEYENQRKLSTNEVVDKMVKQLKKNGVEHDDEDDNGKFFDRNDVVMDDRRKEAKGTRTQSSSSPKSSSSANRSISGRPRNSQNHNNNSPNKGGRTSSRKMMNSIIL